MKAKKLAPSSSATAFAPATVGSRKIRIGSKGASTRVSITRNASSSTAATASSEIVRALPQPCRGACDNAYTPSSNPPVTVTAPNGSKRRRPDRDVEVEDVLPADVTGQQAARDQAHGRAARRDGTPGAERFVALRTLREDVHHDRQRSRKHDRRPQSLDAAHHDQESVGRRQRAGERRGGKEREADHHHAPTPEQVRSSAAEQQESSEREPVRGDNPLQVRLAEVQLATDRRQSHVHDRQVDDRHEVRDREHGERAPAMHTLFGNRGLGYSDHKKIG